MMTPYIHGVYWGTLAIACNSFVLVCCGYPPVIFLVPVSFFSISLLLHLMITKLALD